MGSSSSKGKHDAGTPHFQDGNTTKSDVLSSFQLAPPTAAVIGAGMAGVHVAYELAKLGFNVSVFEQRGEIAGGSTAGSLPFVGVGMLTPALFDMPTWKHVVQGILWGNYACPNIVLRDALWPSSISPEFHLWLRGRRRCLMERDEVVQYGNGLSRVSRSVVQEMIQAHPILSSYVSPAPVQVLRTASADGPVSSVTAASTAHDTPLYLDPIGWTRALAALCEKKYKVQFLTSHRVESLNVRYRNNTEMISSLSYSTPSPVLSSSSSSSGVKEEENETSSGWSFWSGTSSAHQKKRVITTSAFDIVVLAAGGETGALTRNTVRLPILNLSGVAVTPAPSATAAIKSRLHRFFSLSSSASPSTSSTTGSSTEEDKVILTELHPGANIFGYHVPASCEPQGSASPPGNAGDTLCVNGLLSTDVTFKSPEALQRQRRRLLRRLSAYLRVFNHIDLPADMWWATEEDNDSLAVAKQPSSTSATTTTAAPLVKEYTLGVSPDGLPIVDFYGGLFNSFVCAGFANRNPDWAPGAAVIVRHLVEEQAQELLLEEREKARVRGIEQHQLPTPTLDKTEHALQQLFSGHLPSDVSGSRVLKDSAFEAKSSIDQQTTMKPPSSSVTTVNPYGTNRFSQGLVPPRSYPDAAPRSPVHMFYIWEDRFVQAVEPWMRSLNQLIVSTAQRDFMPSFIQTAVFCYLYDPDQPSEEERMAAKKLQDRMHRVIAAHELKSAAGSPSSSGGTASSSGSRAAVEKKGSQENTAVEEDWTERSRRSGEEMERQAREFFSGAKVRI